MHGDQFTADCAIQAEKGTLCNKQLINYVIIAVPATGTELRAEVPESQPPLGGAVFDALQDILSGMPERPKAQKRGRNPKFEASAGQHQKQPATAAGTAAPAASTSAPAASAPAAAFPATAEAAGITAQISAATAHNYAARIAPTPGVMVPAAAPAAAVPAALPHAAEGIIGPQIYAATAQHYAASVAQQLAGTIVQPATSAYRDSAALSSQAQTAAAMAAAVAAAAAKMTSNAAVGSQPLYPQQPLQNGAAASAAGIGQAPQPPPFTPLPAPAFGMAHIPLRQVTGAAAAAAAAAAPATPATGLYKGPTLVSAVTVPVASSSSISPHKTYWQPFATALGGTQDATAAVAAAGLPVKAYSPDEHPVNRMHAVCCIVTPPRIRVYKKRDGRPGGNAVNVTVLMPQNNNGYITRITVRICC